ncbi:MAG TPA: HlyD family efflux transporter periplasmic adaptor subunit [Candidatus Binatia bacterium]|nr:HlyD family efflux transporter periplasmic adaptor subunit [Candidatus Binatia bacterium]
MLTKPLIALACLAFGGIVIGWTWHARNGHKVMFNTAVVRHGELVATISATGTIEPVEVVDVGAQVAGLIKAFGKDKSGHTIDYGSIVEEGTVLANIDDSVYAADLALARAQVEQDKAGELSAAANLQQMKARLIQTEADWNRAQELSRSKLLATADYDSYKANYEIAKANVSVADATVAQAGATTVQARALLEKAQRNLDFCTIKSPVKGVIIDRRVNIGQTVVASLNAPSLFLIAEDLTKMQIWVAVNEADVGRIVPGAPVTFTCDTFPGREFDGTVGKVRLNATMTQNVVMYTVEVNTENPDSLLLPYLTANVRFVVHGETNALLVPNAAFRWTPSSLAQVIPEARAWKPSDPEPKAPGAAPKAANQDKAPKSRVGTVWLKDGEFVRPLEVKAGASDGANTAVVSDLLKEGQEVVTGEIVETAQTGTQNPFVPQFRKR